MERMSGMRQKVESRSTGLWILHDDEFDVPLKDVRVS